MKNKILFSVVLVISVMGFLSAAHEEEKIKTAAREIVEASKYCTLISMGEDGYPNARVMDAFKPDRNWVIWMGTNPESRKVKEILKNKRISVFYESSGGDGYVILKGNGLIVDDEKSKARYFKEEWEEFYPQGKDKFVLIKFIPGVMEVVSYKRGLLGKENTWEAPSVTLNEQ